MRLVHFAYFLTAALLAVTTYLAWEGQQAARGAREELDFLKKKQAAQEAGTAVASAFSPVAGATPAATITPPVPGVLAAPTQPAGAATAVTGADELPGGGLTIPKAVAEAEAKGINTNTLTPAQKQVKAAPAVAKIKTIVKDQGFVVLDAGSKQGLSKGQELLVRRENGVLGRLKVADTIEENEAVADLDLSSIPPGVTIEPGDDVIQPVAR
ncbi:MAG: hypothetical protein LDL31_12665 [Prosthecobacter sp.]|jgi:hypothetical protein|nr:hypothetical protein [Prosthecobacter sp.]